MFIQAIVELYSVAIWYQLYYLKPQFCCSRYDVFNVFNLSGWLIMTLREVVKIYIFQPGTKRHELE